MSVGSPLVLDTILLLYWHLRHRKNAVGFWSIYFDEIFMLYYYSEC